MRRALHDSAADVVRQDELVRLLGSAFNRRTLIPCRNRVLLRRIERFDGTPDLVYTVGKKVSNQKVGDGAGELGVALHESAEAEAVVVLAHEAAHTIDPLIEPRSPVTKLRGRRVVLREP